jgi:hypothetical protein
MAPNCPAEPIERTDPTEPIEKTDPAEPIEKTEPIEETEPIEAVLRTDAADPALSTENQLRNDANERAENAEIFEWRLVAVRAVAARWVIVVMVFPFGDLTVSSS